MFTSAIKKQTFFCCSISLNPYWYFKLGIWNHGKKRKRKPNCLSSSSDASKLFLDRLCQRRSVSRRVVNFAIKNIV